MDVLLIEGVKKRVVTFPNVKYILASTIHDAIINAFVFDTKGGGSWESA